MLDKSTKFILIPEYILMLEELNLQCKAVFGLINGLCQKSGECCATNEWLCSVLSISERQLIRYINQLEKLGYLTKRGETRKRRLVTSVSPISDINDAISDKSGQISDVDVTPNIINIKENKKEFIASASASSSSPDSSLSTEETKSSGKAKSSDSDRKSSSQKKKEAAPTVRECMKAIQRKMGYMLDFDAALAWCKVKQSSKKPWNHLVGPAGCALKFSGYESQFAECVYQAIDSGWESPYAPKFAKKEQGDAFELGKLAENARKWKVYLEGEQE